MGEDADNVIWQKVTVSGEEVTGVVDNTASKVTNAKHMLLCLVQGLKETAERMNTDHKETPASYHYHQPNKNIIMW